MTKALQQTVVPPNMSVRIRHCEKVKGLLELKGTSSLGELSCFSGE